MKDLKVLRWTTANGTRRHVELDQKVGQWVGWDWSGLAVLDHDILETELEICSPNRVT